MLEGTKGCVKNVSIVVYVCTLFMLSRGVLEGADREGVLEWMKGCVNRRICLHLIHALHGAC